MQPVASATTPKDRPSSSVKSLYSSSSAQAVGNFNGLADWGQKQWGNENSDWAEFDLNGDKILQYTNLSYQGNTFDAVDLTGMEYIHFDVWTADMSKLELSIIDTSVSTEKPVVVDLVKDEWNSIDIPISS